MHRGTLSRLALSTWIAVLALSPAHAQAPPTWPSCRIEAALPEYERLAGGAADAPRLAELEATLREATGLALDEPTPAARLAAARVWWDANRVAAIDRDVARSVEQALVYLRRVQLRNGSWRHCNCDPPQYTPTDADNGTTALIVYTLVMAGVPTTDKAVQAGLAHLLATDVDKVPSRQTYSISFQSLLLAELIARARTATGAPTPDSPETARLVERLTACAAWIADTQMLGVHRGMWSYGRPGTGGAGGGDNSNSQIAVIALRAAANVGVNVDRKVWERVLDHWTESIDASGGWPYVRGQRPTPSMSSAGLYAVLVAKATLAGKATLHFLDDAIVSKAIAAIERDYHGSVPKPGRPTVASGHGGGEYYTLYSLERALLVAGIERLDRRDWYHDGALYILGNQESRGVWIDVCDTCFAVLFLRRAFVPVVLEVAKPDK